MIDANIQTLYDTSMALLNVGPNKVPLQSNYLLDKVETLLLKFVLNINKGNGYAMRMGYNDAIDKTFISLDFDCCKKNDKTGKYEDCQNTKALLDEYQQKVNSTDGMFSSSTSGNYNILVDITNSERLLEAIEYCPAVWSAFGYGLEILIHKIQVIPPTATKCKKDGVLQPRSWLGEKVVYEVVDDGDPIVDFVMDYFEKPAGKQTNHKKYESKKLKKYNNAFEEQQEDYIICRDDLTLTEKILTKTKVSELSLYYNSWWKMGYAIFNTHGEQGKEVFIKFSTNNKYKDTDAMEKYWDENICGFSKTITTKYNLINSWYIVKFLKVLDYDKYTEYIETIFDNLEEHKMVAKFQMVEDPEGAYRLAKIIYGGNNYIIWNKPDKKINIVNWESIQHILNERFDETFLDHWYKSPKKKRYDKVDFIPYGEADKDIFNLFQGFPHHSLIDKEGFTPNRTFINHFKEYCKRVCSGKKEAGEFLEQNIAWICFKGRPEICVVIYGSEGTGKSSLVNFVKVLIGKNYCVDDCDTKNGLFKNFNAQFEGKILVCINEPDWSSFSRSMGIFKHSITEETLRIEKKGVDPYEITNHSTYWICTNNPILFTLQNSSRRFFFVNCEFTELTTEQRATYFTDFYANKINNEEYIASVLWYLKNEVLDENYKFEVESKKRLTEYHKIVSDTYKQTDISDWLCDYLHDQQNGYRWNETTKEMTEQCIDNPLDQDYWVNEDEFYRQYKADMNGARITSKDLFVMKIKEVSGSNDITKRPQNSDGKRHRYIRLKTGDIRSILISKNIWRDE